MRIKRALVALALSLAGFFGSMLGTSPAMAQDAGGPVVWVPGSPWNSPGSVSTTNPKRTEIKPIFQNHGPTARQVQLVLLSPTCFNTWSRWHARYGWASPTKRLTGRVLANAFLPANTTAQPIDRFVSNMTRPYLVVLARDTEMTTDVWNNWLGLPGVNNNPWQIVAIGRLQKNGGGVVDSTIDVRTPVHGVTVENMTGVPFASWEFAYANGHVQRGTFTGSLANTASMEFLPDTAGVPFVATFKVTGTSGVVFTISEAQVWDGFNAVTITAVAPPPPPSTTVTFGNDTADGIVFGSYILQYEDGTSKTDSLGSLAFGQRQAVVAKSGLRFTAQLVVSSSTVSGVSPGSKFRYLTESGYDDPATAATNESQVLGDPADQLTQFNALAVGGNLDLIAN